MFETAIAYYLNEYLGTYVEGIDKEALSVSVIKGDVTLKNSRIKPDAFAEHFDLPVSVRAGMLETLTLKVPWNALGSTPVVVTVDGMYLLVRAMGHDTEERDVDEGRGAEETDLPLDSVQYFEAGFQQAKMARVQRKEQKWVREQKEAREEGAPSTQPSFLSSLIETIVGNLQISIRNIHIRYEDDVTRPGHAFACGFTLQNLEAFTIDASGSKRFVSAKAMDALRKAVQLERLAVYFDCNLSQDMLWSPSVDAWRGMGSAEWDSWFRPAIVGDDSHQTMSPAATSASSFSSRYSYVLRPVDGEGRYVRKRDVAELDVQLDSIAVSVSQDQYQNYSLLLSEASEYFKRAPFQTFRPRMGPKHDPRAWWLYVLYALRQQQAAKQRLGWVDVLEYIRLRPEYISLYKVLLRMEDMRDGTKGAITHEVEALYDRDMAIMHDLEKRLPESTILVFRRVARAEYLAELSASQAAQAAVEAERRKNESNSGGWLGWLMGTGADAPEAITTVTTKEEQDAIVDAMASTGISVTETYDEIPLDTFGRQRRYAVRVNSVSMNLVNMGGEGRHRTLLRGSMTGIGVEFAAYPDQDMEKGTRDVRVSIDGSAIESYKGSFTESQSLSVHFITSPPDGLSDATLRVDMAPSFVYYDPEVVSSVVEFFKPPEELVLNDLADLSVAAAAQLSRARQLAQEYAVATWSDKPKLDMRLRLNAPKISIPSKNGDVHLALDFGVFLIETDREGSAALPPREVGLYECVKISGSRVSARFMGSVVNWDDFEIQEALLDECTVDMPLHIARYVDVELPALRAAPTIPRIRMTMSPKKLDRLVKVLQNCVESFGAHESSASVTTISEEAWLSSAAWKRDCLVLQWGTLQSSATWARQKLVLYTSTLYAVEVSSNRILRQWTISTSSLVTIIGCGDGSVLPFQEADRVVIMYDGDGTEDLRDVVRDPGSWVVKFDSAKDAELCVEELHAVIHRQNVEIWESALQVGSEDTVDIENGGWMRSLQIEVEARLMELQIRLVGRCISLDHLQPPVVGPEESPEADLVCINASKGTLSISYGSKMRIGVSLAALEIQDLLSSSWTTGDPKPVLAHSIQDALSTSPNLADFEIETWGSQTSVNANLGSLCFFCHRPTVAALIAFGTDVAGVFSAGHQQSSGFDGDNLPGSDAAQDILAPEMVLYCEKKDAITFALHVQLSKLQLRLCYEDGTDLAEAFMTDFSFSMDNISDGRSKISASLGNLKAVDLTLKADNPHAQICGLREGDSSSLVSISLYMIPGHVESPLRSPDVPPNTPCYYLQASLSKVQVTFLYRFVQEQIRYVDRLMELQPPALDNGEASVETFDQGLTRTATPALATGQEPSSILLLKVEMEAPLITIPRSSESKDGLRADLGTLTLMNKFVSNSPRDGSEGGTADDHRPVLLDVSTLRLSGIQLKPTSGIRGDDESMVRQSNDGWTVSWKRPLSGSDSSMPGYEVEVDIPTLDASISNEEYGMVRTIVTDNLSEPTRDDGPTSNLGSIPAETPRARRTSVDSVPRHHEDDVKRNSSMRMRESLYYRIYINLRDLQLRLSNPASLGLLQVENLYISYSAFRSGSTLLNVSMPKLEVTDTRPHPSGETSTVISSGQHASMLVIRYATGTDGRDLEMILQKPHIALELGFLIDLTAFFVPAFSYSRSEPLPFRSHDILLTPVMTTGTAPFCLKSDIWLSPLVRILADSEPGSTYHIDGCGHDIVLPEAAGIYNEIPLIMVGVDCILELSNVTLVNSDSLSSCVRLGPGARLDLAADRGVRLENKDRGILHNPEATQFGRGSSEDGKQIEDDNGGLMSSERLSISLKTVNLGLNLMPRRATDEASPARTSATSSSKRIIAFKMDIEANYSSSSDQGQKFTMDVFALRAAQKSSKPSAAKPTKEMDILLPTAISFGYSSTNNDIDMNLEVSEVSLMISPGSLALMTHYAEEALAPLRQPGPDSPVFAASTYRKVAAPSGANGFNESCITFWRPIVPNGYLVVGDLAMGGDRAPNFEVIALARNSGLVAHPDSFLPIISNEYLSLWLPVAPDGYVPLGLVATTGVPPNPTDIGCVARGAVITAPRGSSLEHWGGFDGICLVNVDNSFGTFIPEEAGAFDLRLPVGPTTYALSAKGPSVDTSWSGCKDRLTSFEQTVQRDYVASERKKQRVESRSVNSPKTMEFRRIWSDHTALSGPAGVSIWRPVPHPGYAILGDCFVTGLDPPKFVHLLRVEAYSRQTAAEAASSAPPLDFEFVWHDGNPRPESRLTIWRPVAPEGYRSMGNIAHVGMAKPEVPELHCALERLVHPSVAPRRPVWTIAKDHISTSSLNVWQVDEQTGCFFVNSSDRAVPPHGYALDMSTLEGREEPLGKTVNYVVKSPAIRVIFFDSFGVPMVRSDVLNIESGIRGFSQQVVQAYGGFRPSLSAYNPTIGTWEQVVQSFDAIATGSLNMSKRSCSGIDPGVRITLKSSTEMIRTTLALHHMNAVVSAYEECIMALDEGDKRAGDAAGQTDRESLYGGKGRRSSVMVNRLGFGVNVQLEDIETKCMKLISINDGEATTIQRTYHGGGLQLIGHSDRASSRAVLLVDVKELHLVGQIRGARVAVSTWIQIEGADGMNAGLSPRTRAIVLQQTPTIFQERLVLVCGFDKITQASCIIDILDVEACGGRGAVIGRARIPSSSLQHLAKVLTPLDVSIEPVGKDQSNLNVDKIHKNSKGSLGSLSCEVAWQRLGYLKNCPGYQEKAGAALNTDMVSPSDIVGQRAISIQGIDDVFRIVPEALRRPGRDRSPDGNATGVRTAVLLGEDTVVLEGHINQHVWHETLRSNLKVENKTNVPLCIFLSFTDGKERSLGTVGPHTNVPLPLGWQRPGSQLHITPALYEEGRSKPAESKADDAKPPLRYRWGSVEIAALVKRSGSENGRSLWSAYKTPLECAPKIQGNGLSMMFCLGSSSDSVQNALDWRIEIVPPIKIRNHVPVPVSMFVADGGDHFVADTSDFPVHLDIVDPGEDLPIYFTGSKGALRFRMDAGEYKWAEREMVYLTGSRQRDSIRLQSDTQRIPSDIVLSRHQTSQQATYPVVITLIAPLWILNKTDWIIETAVVPVTGASDKGIVALDPQHVPQEESYGAVLVTSAEELPGSDPQGSSPINARQIPPKSLVLSSFPLGNLNGPNTKNLASGTGSGNQGTRAYGLRVRVQRSGWTDAILLDEDYASKHGTVALSSRPVLLKADSPAHSAVFGTVLRLEMNEFNDSRILNIDAHMMLQNSCRVDLEGFQTVIDRGRRHLGAQRERSPVNRQGTHSKKRERLVLPRGGIQLEDDDNHPFVQMADNSIQTILKAKAIFTIPADSVARPLAFLRGAGAPTLCFRNAHKTAYESVGIWSRPLELDVLEEGVEYVVLPCIDAGSLERTLLLRLSVTSRGPGLRLVTLESTECLPRYTLTNKGLDELLYRETGWLAATAHRLPGLSSVGVVPTFTTDPDIFELEVFGHGMEQYATKVVLSDRSGNGDGTESSEPSELVISSTKSCMVRTLFQPPTCLSCVGINLIEGVVSGYSVGRGSIEKTVDIVGFTGVGGNTGRPTSSLVPGNQRETFVVFEVPGISLSIVDFEREIALLTLDDVKVEVDRILMPQSTGSFIRVLARHAQLDNQLPGTLLPVTICKSIESRSGLPVIDFRHASYQSKTRSGLHLPYIGCRTPDKIQLAVDERLVWKLVEYAQAVTGMQDSSKDAGDTLRSVDAFVRLRLLSVASMALSVSFQNNAKARPPSFQDTSYSLMLDLAAFKGAEIKLKGFEFENMHVSQSVMTARVIERIRGELVSASFSLIRQFGIVGGASRLFGFLGAKVARFAEGPSTASGTPTAPPQDATFGASFLKGFRGVVGAFAPATKSQEKQDASFARGRSGVMMLQRKRLPRVLNKMSGMRDANATSSSLLESLGQALLWSTWLASPLTQNARLEDFEEHVVLPNGLVLLFTSASLLLVHAPGFAALDGAVERNGLLPAEVAPGIIQWRILWRDINNVTLSSSVPSDAQIKATSDADADVVVIHPKTSHPMEISCFPGTPQAREIVIIAIKIREFYLRPS